MIIITLLEFSLKRAFINMSKNVVLIVRAVKAKERI